MQQMILVVVGEDVRHCQREKSGMGEGGELDPGLPINFDIFGVVLVPHLRE